MGTPGWVLFIQLAIAAGAYIFLSRRACLVLAVIALVLGVVAPMTIWGYGTLFVRHDPSGYGMLGTLLAVIFAPGGIALAIEGLLKRS